MSLGCTERPLSRMTTFFPFAASFAATSAPAAPEPTTTASTRVLEATFCAVAIVVTTSFSA